ncbi:MAG: ABC transporter ATP-binding protein [Clostridium baratii]|nr:ABC transporter ATP-binding protein [Clostridium baratii]MDU1053835.1 ABC transporter ATP-binding protein [Clostridium baratii]
MNDNILMLKGISKKYGDNEVLKDLYLNIKKNEFLTLLGPSGCGKTTTLKIIAGFETADSGKVMFDDKDMATLPSHKRPVNTVFQKYALFPHMNVYDNIAFGLKIKKVSKEEIDKKVTEMLKMVALSGFEKRSIDSLSGGLGALDLKLRKEMQIELKKIQQRLGITFIFVTHDQEEALTMSDTIVVMNKGLIQQMGSPQDIYNEPANAFVADFIGESNIVDGIMLEDYKTEFCGNVFDSVDKGFNKNEPVDIVVRPEDIKMVSKESGMLRGKVLSVVFKGVHYEIEVKLENCNKNWIIHNTKSAEVGSTIGLDIYPEDIHVMNKVTCDE